MREDYSLGSLDIDYKENLAGMIMSPAQQQSIKLSRVAQSLQQQDSTQSLKLQLHPVQNITRDNYLQQIKKQTNTTKSWIGKNVGSCEQSLNQVTPISRTHAGGQHSSKNYKQPLYSMIPQTINKNLNKNSIAMKDEASKAQYGSNYIQKTNAKTTVLFQNEPEGIRICEESDILSGAATITSQLRQNINQSSQVTLTPQKSMPVPVSPSSKPTLTNCSKSGQNSSNNQPQARIMSMNQQYQQNIQQYSQTKNNNPNSGQKPTVVYNEFKYYTSGADLINPQNQRKYINISNSGIGFQRRSEIGLQNIQTSSNGQSGLHFELSPTDHKIFDMSSPKHSITSNLMSGGLRSSSIRQQIINTGSNLSTDLNHKNYQLQLKQQDSEDQLRSEAQEKKIRQLQEYIENLENDLKESQERNSELKQKIKDKNALSSFDKSKKHLSDTEDSLILSEKKAVKRNSKGLNNNSFSQLTHDQNHKSNSSIVDVKIRPINNMKGSSPARKIRDSNSGQKIRQEIQPKKNSINDDEKLEYQVQDYNDHSVNASSISEHNKSCNQENVNDSTDMQQQQSDEDECEGCERLKHLVFQAKEAIDDLKLEIEEWRDICSDKETELRRLQHKLYNDIIGVDKKIEFDDEIQTKEFDCNKPVNIDSRKVRNYIQHNKKRIRSRSKNNQKPKGSENAQAEGGQSNRKISVVQSLKKKSALKNMNDLVNDEFEFYEAEDQGIQTSFHIQTTNDCMTNISTENASTRKVTNVVTSNYYLSNHSITPDLELKENNLSLLGAGFARINDDNHEEINTLRTKTQLQEQEISKLRQQVMIMTKQTEQFLSLVNKSKKKVKKTDKIDLNDIKENYELVSSIESYSILEKINEWKREEGLIDDQNADYNPPMTQIPRPLKLIMDIDLNEIELFNGQKANTNVYTNQQQQRLPLQNQVNNGNSEFLQIIKQEQEILRKQQESKYKELQKQQQDYINLLKGI